jgi:hypothetical protein
VFSEIHIAPVLPERTPLQRTGCERYSPSFRELAFSETRLPAYAPRSMPMAGRGCSLACKDGGEHEDLMG